VKDKKKTKHQSSSSLFKPERPFSQNLKRQVLGKRAFLFFFKFFEKGVFHLLFFEKFKYDRYFGFREETIGI